MSYIECKILTRQALRHLSSFEQQQWWLQSRPELDGSAAYLAIHNVQYRATIVSLARGVN